MSPSTEKDLPQAAFDKHESIYRQLFNQLGSGAAIYRALDDGRDFQFLDLNHSAERLSNFDRRQVIGRTMLELIPNIKELGLYEVFQRVWRSGRPEYLPAAPFREGSFTGWIETYVFKINSGEIIAIFGDVTARKQAQDLLRIQNDLLESTIEALDHPFYVVDTTNHVITLANSAARQLNPDPQVSTCYKLTHRIDEPCSGDNHLCPIREVIRTKKPVVVEHIHFDAHDRPIIMEVRGYPLFDAHGEVTSMIEYTLDITERKQAEEATKAAAAIAERERLARDLHDAVNQNLFSAGLIAELVPDLWQIDPDEAARSLVKLRQLIRATSAEMRSMLLELRPNRLVETPLASLLSHLAESVAGRAEINVHAELADITGLPDDVKIAIYRIAQEALNNVAKHAHAQSVWLSCQVSGESLCLLVEDDGRGFDRDAIPPGHLGVGIMHERAAQIGARLDLQSQPGAGTSVSLCWPIEGDVHG